MLFDPVPLPYIVLKFAASQLPRAVAVPYDPPPFSLLIKARPLLPFQKLTVAVSPVMTRLPQKFPKFTPVSASPLVSTTRGSVVVRTHPVCITSAMSQVPAFTPLIE